MSSASERDNVADRHLFGMKKQGLSTQHDPSDNYEQRFAEDHFGEEAGPNARVWRTYLVESAAFDENMIGEARDGLDAMLVFAGLFSAVVTSFLVQTADNLQVDYTEMSASLLYELIAVQRATAQGTLVSAVPVSSLNPQSTFTPNTLDVWVNALWVVSLALGLVVALASVLVKQWLHRYLALSSGSPGEQSHIRQFRYIGFQKWQVLGIIGSLPVIMHISLALFFLGLVLFLIRLKAVLAWVIGGITAVVYVLYLLTNILPVFDPQCPYQTPLSDFFLVLCEYIRSLTFTFAARARFKQRAKKNHRTSYRKQEKSTVDSIYDELSVRALHWLYQASSNTSVHSVIIQAIAGLPITVADQVSRAFRYQNIQPAHEQLLRSCVREDDEFTVAPGMERVAERLYRVFLFFVNHMPNNSVQSMWKHKILLSDHARLNGTALAVYESAGTSSQRQLQDGCVFLLAHATSLVHHPLVWVHLLDNLFAWCSSNDVKLDVGDKHAEFSSDSKDIELQALIIRMSLPAVWGPKYYHFPSTIRNLATMEPAIRKYARERVSFRLLEMLAAYDEEEHSSILNNRNDRVMLAIMKFISAHLFNCDPSTRNRDSVFWSIVDYVFEELHGPLDAVDGITQARRHKNPEGPGAEVGELEAFQTFMAAFVDQLVDESNVCDSHLSDLPGEDTFFKRRTSVLNVYERTRHWLISTGQSPSPFTSLYRAVSGTLGELPLVIERQLPFDTMHRLPFESPLPLPYAVALNVVALALSDGCVQAYEAVVKYDCFAHIAQYQVYSGFRVFDAEEFCGNYVMGLSGDNDHDVDDGARRMAYVGYLYQPRNLCLVVLSLTRREDYEQNIVDLFRLGGDFESRKECLQGLKNLLDWVARNSSGENQELSAMALQDFTDRQLGEEWTLKWLQLFLECFGILHLRRATKLVDTLVENLESNIAAV